MATGALVSVEEYLHTSYRPDCEYIDGVIQERNVGETDHSRLQALLSTWLCAREKPWGTLTLPGQRVQVKATRFRVPDLCIVLGPRTVDPIIRKPPFVCIEIVSSKDTFDSMWDRIDDYLAFGVPYVWFIHPRSRRAFVYTTGGGREAKEGILRTENPEIVLALAEVFSALG